METKDFDYEKEFETSTAEEFQAEEYDTVIKNKKKLQGLFSNRALKSFAGYLPQMLAMLRDFFTGKYREIPKGTISAILFALIYVLAPFDMVTDMIPVIGLMDDASVIAACVHFIATDLEKYKQWKGLQ